MPGYEVEATLEAELGHPLGPPGQVRHLNETPAWVIEDVRRLSSRLLRVAYLWHMVPYQDRHAVYDFIDDIAIYQKPVTSWRRGRVVMWRDDPDRLFSTSVDDLLAGLKVLGPLRRLNKQPMERMMRGAPVAIVPEADYRWQSPPGMTSYAFDTASEPVADAPTAMRQWLARLIEWHGSFMGPLPKPTAEGILRRIAPSVDTFSEDAEIAVRAWLRAHSAGLPLEHAPDAWFQKDATPA